MKKIQKTVPTYKKIVDTFYLENLNLDTKAVRSPGFRRLLGSAYEVLKHKESHDRKDLKFSTPPVIVPNNKDKFLDSLEYYLGVI